MAKRKRPNRRPAGSAQFVGEDVWYYESMGSIELYAERRARTAGDNRVGRISWKQIMESARRCGYVVYKRRSRSQEGSK